MRTLTGLIAAAFVTAGWGCGGEPVDYAPDDALAPAEIRGDSTRWPDIRFADQTEPDLLSLDFGGAPDESDDPGNEVLTPECEPGEGCLFDRCSQNADCLSGWCVGHMGESLCTKTCVLDCPAGFTCKLVSGTQPDAVFICISDFPVLCRPCAASSDCISGAGEPGVCVDYGPDGDYCGGACKADGDCPWGFVCEEVVTVDGVGSQQCVSATGQCPCASHSVELAAWTSCERSSEWGTCKGQRMCSDTGLSDCDAPVPQAEVCNGIDDDCDGNLDEGEGGGAPALCDDGNECTTDSCLGAGGCTSVPQDGAECSDGDPCTQSDECQSGVCKGFAVTCDDNNPCTSDSCDPQGDCQNDPTPGACDDGDDCTLGDACVQGSCVAGIAVNCADNNPCTDDSCDPSGGCLNETNEAPCEDGNPCTVNDLCTKGACVGGADVDCDDGNPCTVDACQAGVGCLFMITDGPCDDQNACTTLDHCSLGVCTSSALVLCDDKNICTTDLCAPDVGCSVVFNEAPCNDNDVCTVDDGCDQGKCVSKSTLKCDDGNQCTVDSCDPELGCDFAPVDMGPPPVASSNSPACEGGDIQLVTDEVAGAEYLWKGPNGFISSLRNPTLAGISAANAGTYQVQVIVNGCPGPKATVDVVVLPASHGVKSFTYTGSAQSWVVPECATKLTVEAYGAQGGYPKSNPSLPGKGGKIQAVVPVTPGTTLYVLVGGEASGQSGGYNGGGNGSGDGQGAFLLYGGGGGGASDIRAGGQALADRILVAGGGGGAGRDGTQPGNNGGGGGGSTGQNGSKSYSGASVGTGGSQNAGGSSGGTLGAGGNGTYTQGGGGGGGYYGGGGASYAGGGGGSSFAAVGSYNIVHTQGVRSGSGEVTLSW